MEQNRGLLRKSSGTNPSLSVTGVSANGSTQQIGENTMRQSNGFITNSSGITKMRISGQSFRPSSRDRNSMNNESKVNDQEFVYSLNILPLNQDEFTFASAIKADLLQLQEEIGALDPDNRLRSNGNIDFGKGYQTTLKKWLNCNNEANIKQSFDRRMKAELDSDKLCEILGHKGNSGEALKKLFRLCMISDFMSTKLTEFEVLSLLRFDESYSNLVKDEEINAQSSGSISKTKIIGGSGPYQFSKYQICFANLERFANLIRSSKKLASRQGGEFMLGNDGEKIQILDREMKELKETIKKLEQKIKELNEKNVDLQTKIENFQEQLIEAKNNSIDSSKQVQKVIGKSPESFKENPDYWTRLIDETKELYEGRIRAYEKENVQLKEKLEDQKIKTETIQDQMIDLSEKVNALSHDKDQLFVNFSKRYSTKEEAANSYEDALKDEFDRMKKAFEKRIDTLAWDNERVKKEKARGLIDMKLKMDKEIETKSLLLKKLSCYIK